MSQPLDATGLDGKGREGETASLSVLRGFPSDQVLVRYRLHRPSDSSSYARPFSNGWANGIGNRHTRVAERRRRELHHHSHPHPLHSHHRHSACYTKPLPYISRDVANKLDKRLHSYYILPTYFRHPVVLQRGIIAARPAHSSDRCSVSFRFRLS